MLNFWTKLKKPFFCLAPMEGVTDCAFREIFAKYGRSDKSDKSENQRSGFVMFTEFVNVDGLLHPEGFERLKIDLVYTEAQRPIVAQIWGRDPEKFYQAAKIIARMGFDGIDINMGCPQDKEISQKTCAALIREPDLAQYIIRRAKEGAGSLPVSVKTRIGYSGNEIAEWLPVLLKAEPAAISIHARSKKDKSKVPARWDAIAQAVEIRNTQHKASKAKRKVLIIGNGDIQSGEEGLRRVAETGCDGVMIGRGAFGNPWLFAQQPQNKKTGTRRSLGEPTSPKWLRRLKGGSGDDYQPSIKERLEVMLEHAELYEKMYKGVKSFALMRKNFKAYATGFDGAHELRVKLMETENALQVKGVVDKFLAASRHQDFQKTAPV